VQARGVEDFATIAASAVGIITLDRRLLNVKVSSLKYQFDLEYAFK
jgi:hypothetical protein